MSATPIPAAVCAELHTWSRAARPREACGLLLGVGSRVTRAVRLANVAPEAERFELDPGGFVRVERDARRDGLSIAGVWHSHPAGPPRPSAADVAGALRGERGWLHVIVAAAAEEGAPDAVAGYRLRAGSLVRERVVRTERDPMESAR